MNNYDNAEPKPLKFLVSDGKLVDESGNVIAESDSLQDLYIKSSPQVKKYLLSDGSVVDENNNLIIKNDYYKKVYDQATPKVAKYLHSDGTIDENPGSGSGGKVTAYAWHVEDTDLYFDFDVVPQTLEELLTHFAINNESSIITVKKIEVVIGDEGFTRISDTKFSMADGSDVFVVERSDSSYDFTLWEAD